MDGRPALTLALLFALVTASGPYLAVPPSVGSGCLLLLLGVAFGGRAGLATAVVAGAILLGRLHAPESPHLVTDRVVDATGRICGPWIARFDGASAPFCAVHLEQGRRLRIGEFRLRVDLERSVPVPPLGSRVRVRGVVSRSTGFANETTIPPGPLRLRVKATAFLTVLEPPSVVDRKLGDLRRRARALFETPERAGRPGTGLARALLLGDPVGLAPESRLALRRSGLAHLIAVSGFNVTLVAILAAAIGSGLPRVARLTAIAVALSFYVSCVGGSASVLRAYGMALLAIAALALGRAPRAGHALAASAFLLLATDPAMVHEPGFRLSFAATAGLLLLTARWGERLERLLPRPLAVALAASLAAQAASLPLSAATFGEIPPAAPVLNLLAVPWAAICLVLAFAWTLVAVIASEAADLLLPVLDWAAAPLSALAALPPSPLLSIPWTGGLFGALVPAGLIGAIGEGGAVLRHALLGLALLAQTGSPSSTPSAFEVLFVDVGQGDATLLRRGRRAVLVDGGGAPGVDIGARVMRPLLATRGLSRIEVAVLTHADLDHCQGLVDLAAYVPIDDIWAAESSAGSPCLAELARLTRRAPRWLARGDQRSAGGFEFEVLHPPRSAAAGSDNASSLVLAVEGGGRRLLLAADVDATTERGLISTQRPKLVAELLKVAHHGSSGSSHDEFLAAVRPRLAIVSAGGRNPYGHPSWTTIARLRGAGARVLRTDRDGLVVVHWMPGGPWRLELPGSPRRVAPGQ